MIIDGKIKLKAGSSIESFTRHGLKFADGSELDTDVVLFATGYGDPRDPIRQILGPQVGQKLPQIWGLTEEGEIPGCWKELNLNNVWLIMGNFAFCRFYSKRLALRAFCSHFSHLLCHSRWWFPEIKAKQEGVFNGKRYSAPLPN